MCLFVVGTVLQAEHPAGFPGELLPSLTWVAGILAYPVVGVLVVQHRPRNPVGWLLLGIGLAFGIGLTVDGVSTLMPLSGAEALVYLLSGAFFQGGFALTATLLLVFPTGRFAGQKWRWVAVALWVLVSLSFVGLFTRVGPVAGPGSADNPWAVPAVDQILGPVSRSPGFLLFGGLLIASAVSVFLRFRRADDDLRAQLLWFTLGAATLAIVLTGDAILQLTQPDPGPVLSAADTVLEGLAFGALAVAIAIAMLRHRLFDVDRVAVRTLAYGTLAVIVTGGYVAVVALAGAGFGALGLSGAVAPFVAAAVMAIAFQPLRLWMLRLGERIVVGRRATPYQVLAQTGRQVAGALSTQEALPAMADALSGATGGVAAIWLVTDSGPVLAALAPANGTRPHSPRGATFEVVQGGELLGVLSITRGTPLTRSEERLVEDLAAQAGIVLRNALLTTELEQRLADLRSAAGRLTTATETERRRLERDLHDGVQQQLTALTMKIGRARALAVTDPAAAEQMLGELAADSAAAMRAVREFSRGVFPALLTSSGLRAALTARSRHVPVPVLVRCPDQRFPPEIEAAAYFCCAEALQNATKHAAAKHIRVEVVAADRSLRLWVRDDGVGFDAEPALAGDGAGLRNMTDRFTALGGWLRIESTEGGGTTITGSLPLPCAPS